MDLQLTHTVHWWTLVGALALYIVVDAVTDTERVEVPKVKTETRYVRPVRHK